MAKINLKLSESTRRAYRHWIDVFKRRHGSITTVTQYDIDAFFAWMVRDMEYPRSTVNQAKNAIKHYAAANGIEFDIRLVSLRTDTKLPDLISDRQAACIIATIEPFYQPIAEVVFHGCQPPGFACGQHRSAIAGTLAANDATVSPRTFGLKLKAAAKECGVLTPVSPKTLQQSGIVAALRRGVDRNWLMENAQISGHTLARNLRLASLQDYP